MNQELSSEELDQMDAQPDQGAGGELSSDELDKMEAGSAAPKPDANGELSSDELDQMESAPGSSAGGAFVRGAARGAAPAAGGLGAGLLAAGATSEFSPFVSIPVGLAVGLGGGALASKAQDWILDKLGLKQGVDEQAQADVEQHPVASALGEAAPAAAFLKPSGTMLQRLAGGAMGGIAGGASSLMNKGTLDPTDILTGAATGFALPTTNKFGAAIEGAGAGFRGGNKPGAAADQATVDPTQFTGNPKTDAELKASYASIDGMDPSDPMYGHTKNYIDDLLATKDGKAAAGDDGDASQGPGSEQTIFTPADSDRANDVTTTAPGIAAVNAPAPEITGAGNPVGAPMEARTAAATSDPVRDYRKDQGSQGQITQDSVPLSTDGVHPDVASALAVTQPQSGMDQQTVRAPQPPQQPQAAAPAPEPPRQGPIETGLPQAPQPSQEASQLHPQQIQQIMRKGTQVAARRPIVEGPMPSGANSTADPRGPVYVDPQVPPELRRFVAVHETVEGMLQAQGMPYGQAHDYATKAEKAAVERAGVDWNKYQSKWGDILPKIEAQPVPTNLPPGLHVDPEQAIGHYRSEAQEGIAGQEPMETGLGPVTPREQANIDGLTKELEMRGDKTLIDGFKSLNPHEQAARAENIAALLAEEKTAVGEQTKPTDIVAPRYQRKTTDTGVQTGGGARGARKQGALDAMRAAVAKFGGPDNLPPIPTSTPDKAALVSNLKDMLNHAKELHGGADPTVPVKDASGTIVSGYKPRTKVPEYQMLKAASKVVDKPTPANIKAYRTAQAALTGEGTPAAPKDFTGAAKDFQDTARIESDIAKQPNVEQAEANIPSNASREDFPTIPDLPAGKDNSYVEAQNRVRDYVNNLSTPDYETLGEHFDIHNELDEPADPDKLLEEMKDTLGSQKRGVTAKVTPSGANEEPSTFTNDEDDAAAQWLAKNDPTRNSLLSTTKAFFQDEKGGGRPLTGSWKGVKDSYEKIAGNGAKLPSWLTPRPSSPVAPDASAVTKETATQLRKEFNINTGAMANTDMRLAANFAAADGKLTPAERATLYDKLQLQTRPTLTPKEQSFYDEHVKPLEDWDNRAYNIARKQDPSLPEPYTGGTARNYPRLNMQAFDDPKARSNEPWKNTMTDWAAALEDRTWKILDDGNGMRVPFKPHDTDPTKTVLMRNGRPTTMNVAPPTELGQKFTMNVNGTPRAFTVDHAMTPELEANTKLQFVHDPLVALSSRIRGVQGSIIQHKMVEDMLTNPVIKDNSTTDKDEARARGYPIAPTNLDPMAKRSGAPVYYDQRLKWVMDDMAKPGFSDPDGYFDRLGQVAGNLAKPLYFFNPAFHILNVADEWAHAMGQDTLRFKTYPKVISEARQAMQSVYTQDALQERMRATGMQMMAHTQMLDGGLVRSMLQQAGVDLPRKPGILDSFSKATGLNVGDILHQGMRASNKVTWMGNDMFKTALFLRNVREGMNDMDAAAATERFIGRYDATDPTMLGSRALQKVANTQGVSWFGPWHQQLWKSYGNIVKGLMPGSSATPQERKEAAGALFMSGVLMFGVYPYLLDKGAQMVTGNKDAEFGRRGISAVQDAAYHAFKGDKSYAPLMANVLTPSIPVTMATQALSNTRWTGKPIIAPGTARSRIPGQVVDWAGETGIPPYSSVSNALRAPGTPMQKALNVPKKFVEQSFGIKDPSQAAEQYEAKAPRRAMQQEKASTRRPGGPMEMLYNELAK